ncbi:type II toxin-antitoxin system HicA family toxin [Candidatus Woesearchaeota archaeon]|nr:type II toxin-antitoxin system HicA family toxin [Candidatus Woesearchaeota archaeon]
MPKLPVLSGSDVIKVLIKIGFQHTRTSGSHAILNKADKEKGKIIVNLINL